MHAADTAGALLCYEAAARLQEFRGCIDEARALFRAGKERLQALGGGSGSSGAVSSRFLRDWAAFEKRAGDLQARSTLPRVTYGSMTLLSAICLASFFTI